MLNFKNIAQQVGAVESDVIAGRAKTSLDTVVGEVVTIEAFARLPFEKDGIKSAYPVMTVKEYPDAFFGPLGTLFERALFAWADETGCPADDDERCPYTDFTPLNDALAEQELKVCFSKGTTSKGQPLRRFKFVD